MLTASPLRIVLIICYLIITAHSFALETRPQTSVLEIVRFNENNRVDQDVNAFYSQNYRKPGAAKPGDSQYTLRSDVIVATVRLCPDLDNGWIFLRSLCVDRAHRRRGLALNLLRLALDDCAQHRDAKTRVYCFCDTSLSPLYIKAGFRESQENLPKSIVQRYLKLRTRTREPELRCFQWTPLESLDILLIQHTKETTRKTGTAPLLLGTRHLNVNNQTWSGRADNDAIQSVLHEHQENLVLLWTGGESNVSAVSSENTRFLLLDGTWQEARSMFRKIPQLQQLPRLSLQASAPSVYTLRKDFGWKDRFSENACDTLLCTAEVVAELLHQSGNEEGATLLRGRLQDLQNT
jgi:DTW domain-containing protein YfiP/N-acetylglutamate synthase-like GNAT family acetyltransferase